MRVFEMYGALGIKVDQASIRNLNRTLTGIKSMVFGLGSAFAVGGIVKSMVRLGTETEQVRTSIAGMLALSKGTNLSDEMGAAADSVSRLRERAAGLPGSFREYSLFMGRIVQQASKAGLGIKAIEDLTVGATVASKALNVNWMTGARDIDQALSGRVSIRDELTSKLLATLPGYDGADGRKKFNASSREQRAALLMQAFQSKQIQQLATAQANTVGGKIEKLKDQWDLFLLRAGGPLFKALGDALAAVNGFLETHKERLAAVADTVGGVLSDAFGVLKDIFTFLVDNGDVAKGILWGLAAAMGVLAINSLIASAPIVFLIGRFVALGILFEKLRKHVGDFGAAILTAFGAALLFRFGAVVKGIQAITAALWRMRTAQTATQGAGAAVNGLSSMSLGPAGKGAPVPTTKVPGAAPAGPGAAGWLAAAAAPFAIAMLVDSMIPTKANVEAILDSPNVWQNMRVATRTGSLDAGAAAAATSAMTNYAPVTNITMNGVAIDETTVRQIIGDENEKNARRLQVDLAGARR